MLDRKGLGDAGPGDLVVARRTRGRARVERVLGAARPDRERARGAARRDRRAAGVRAVHAAAGHVDGRVDLRELTTFTIDPETAKDFDDALSIDDERAYVHIADVSYFVGAGSPLDRGAAQRAFSTYVPGLVAPMLPHELADDLCSLRPHVDRLCVTVELPLDDDGEPTFYRSVIRSDARLSYGQAQRILAGAETSPHADVCAASTSVRASCGAGASRAARCASRRRRSSSSSTAAAASRDARREGSRRRTRWSRSS